MRSSPAKKKNRKRSRKITKKITRTRNQKKSGKKTMERKTRSRMIERYSGSHKGQNGLVLAVGGSEDYVGAVALTGLAAMRAGADLVTILAPEKVSWAINAMSPDLITKKLKGKTIGKGHAEKILKEAKGKDVVVIGNGIGIKKETKTAVNKILKGLKKIGIPAVIDADALKAIKIENIKDSIITPHRKEFQDFLKTNDRIDVIEESEREKEANPGKKTGREKIKKRKNIEKRGNSREKDKEKNKEKEREELIRQTRKELKDFFEQGNILLLKGKEDIILSKKKAFISKGGNAGMTVGGTGDVLAGICAGYLAQTAEPFIAASMASMHCKEIGDKLLDKGNFGFGYIASDFLKAIKRLKKNKEKEEKQKNQRKGKNAKKSKKEKSKKKVNKRKKQRKRKPRKKEKKETKKRKTKKEEKRGRQWN